MMMIALLSTVVLAAVATAGDWIWASFLARHVMVAGLVHGALLCLAMGAVLGWPAGRTGAGAAAGLAVGLLSAGIFYALAPLLGYSAMFPAWLALWILLSAAQRLLRGGDLRWGRALARGLIAGVASGLAFYLVSGMWTNWNPQAINYAEHFARWAFAFAPGFIVLQGMIRR